MNLYGIKILKVFKIEAIVLYPFILFRAKNPPRFILNHEQIHWNQIKRDGVRHFYFYYLKEYCVSRKNGLSHNAAYREISYEKEAYENQEDENFRLS